MNQVLQMLFVQCNFVHMKIEAQRHLSKEKLHNLRTIKCLLKLQNLFSLFKTQLIDIILLIISNKIIPISSKRLLSVAINNYCLKYCRNLKNRCYLHCINEINIRLLLSYITNKQYNIPQFLNKKSSVFRYYIALQTIKEFCYNSLFITRLKTSQFFVILEIACIRIFKNN